MYIVHCIEIVKCKLCKLWENWFEGCTVNATFASSKEARVSQTGHSRSTSPVRRFDRIWFDCQPAFEIHTALDFKYPSYRAGKAGYQSLICMCIWLVFKMWQIVWRYGPLLLSSLMQQRDESRNGCYLMSTQCESPCNTSLRKPDLNLIWSGMWVDSVPPMNFLKHF